MEYIRIFLNCVSKCFSCKEDPINQATEPNERTHLLADPVNNGPMVRRTNSEDFLNEYPNSLPKRDEQTALNRIVQETATNIIDVAAMDSHNLEPQELNDRVKLYTKRLAQQWNSVQDPSIMPKGLLEDIPNVEEMLSKSPMTHHDLLIIKTFTYYASMAMKDIQIIHREDLVVPFRIP